MATRGPADVGFILVGGFNVLGDTVEFRDKIEALTDTVHSLGDAWHEHAALGLKRAELSQSGYFNDATDGLHTQLVGTVGVSRLLTYGVSGNVVGRPAVSYSGALNVGYERIASLGAIHRVAATYQGNGQVDEGLILHALGARTSDGDSTGADSIDNGASSAGGGVAVLHVVAYSGFSSVVLKVRHSTDDSTYADLVTFATVSGLTAERATTAVTVNRHLAVSWDVTGSGSITFMVGFKRNN